MSFYQFKTEQVLNASMKEVWDFISSPRNLKEITPEYMGFDITSPLDSEKMYQGMIINYNVRPLLNLPTEWVTEITHVEEGAYFVDEQRVGPYKMWHHQHHISPVDEGVLMKDVVSYAPPLGFLGAIANQLVIRRKLKEIFDFRFQVLERRFNKA